MVDTSHMRRLAVTTSAALIFPNSPLAIATTAASIASTTNTAAPLSTTFSCGTRWTTARRCSALCPTGDDDACPPGQHCYGGTSCSAGGPGSEAALARQRRLERLERDAVRRLARRRDAESVPRFVCGGSFAEAEESCGTAALAAAGVGAAATPPRYCATGSSAQCPADAECYAAVPCPRSTHDEEPPLLQAEGEGLWGSSFLGTEPILLNFTTTVAMEEDEMSEEGKVLGKILGWSVFARESSPLILGTVSVLLSSRYGLN